MKLADDTRKILRRWATGNEQEMPVRFADRDAQTLAKPFDKIKPRCVVTTKLRTNAKDANAGFPGK